MINRAIDANRIQRLQELFPVTAILGARQCGKTTLAKNSDYDHYFDLENPRDLIKFENPQLTLEDLQGTIVIDEVQRKPDLFPLLRYLVDTNKTQKYLILGSASRDLIKQSSESLAGRIGYYYLGGFRIHDVGINNVKKLWIRGGFPRAYCSQEEDGYVKWLENYISTFLERDIPQLGITIPSNLLRKFWTMLSHYHGQIINYAELGRNFGMSDMTIRRYVDILEGTFMIRVLMPWSLNINKRLVKRPKIYVKDSGIFHSLQSIETYEQLQSHNKLGASWEGFALESVCQTLSKRNEELFFWRTHAGAEIDLFWQHGGNNWGIEFKFTDAPSLTKSMRSALVDLKLRKLWVVYPGTDQYKLEKNIITLPLSGVGESWAYE